MAFLAFLVSCLVKKDRPEQQQHHEQHHAQEPKPFLSLSMTFMSRGKNGKTTKNPKSPKTPKSPKKRANTSDLDGIDDEDVQRAIMIRKSLASRASSRTCTTGKDKGKGTATPVDVADVDDDSEESLEDDEEGNNPASLKSDWKAYEADLQRNRSVLIRRHPGIDRSPDSAGSAPLTPSSSTCSASPTTPMTSLSIPSAAPSPRASPVPSNRQHTFPCASISRKPVPTGVNVSEGPVHPGVERAATQA